MSRSSFNSTPSATRQLISTGSSTGVNMASGASALPSVLTGSGVGSASSSSQLHARTGSSPNPRHTAPIHGSAAAAVDNNRSGSPSTIHRGSLQRTRTMLPSPSGSSGYDSPDALPSAAARQALRLSASNGAGVVSSPVLPARALGARTPTAAQRRADAAANSGKLPPAIAAAAASPVASSSNRSPVPAAKVRLARSARASSQLSETSEEDSTAASAVAALAVPAVGFGSSTPRHTSHRPTTLIMRQSPPSVQPPLVDHTTTQLIVLANLGGAAAATLDISHKHIRDQVPLANLSCVTPCTTGQVVIANDGGWSVFNPSSPFSEEEKLRRRQAAAMESLSSGLFAHHLGDKSGGGGAGGGVGGNSKLGAAKNKYDEDGKLIEDQYDAARVFTLVHTMPKNAPPTVSSPTNAATPASTAAAAATPTTAAAISPPALPGASAAAMLTTASFLPDGRLLTSDRSGMLRLYADEARKFRLLCEQACGSASIDADYARHASSASTPPSSGSNSSTVLTGLGPRAIVACIPLEDGRLLTAQDAEVSLWDEVPQENFLNAPVFRVDRSFVYTVSEAVNMPGANANANAQANNSTKKRAPIRCALSLPHAAGSVRGLLLTGHDDRSIQVLDLHSFTLRTSLHGHFNSVTCLVELNDGRIASGSTDSNIKIWSSFDNPNAKCDLTLRGHSAPIVSLLATWHPHQLISTSMDNSLRLWNVTTGNCEMQWNLGCEISCLSLLPTSAVSREIELQESDAEMQAIAAIISSEMAEAYTMPGLPAGAFAHLHLQMSPLSDSERERKKTQELQSERVIAPHALLSPTSSSDGSSSRAPSSSRLSARRPSLTLSPSGAYAHLPQSVFASQATPPAVAGLSSRMSARDALIRQRASPASQLVSIPVPAGAAEFEDANDPWRAGAVAAAGATAAAGTAAVHSAAAHEESKEQQEQEQESPAGTHPSSRSKNASPSPHSVAWAPEVDATSRRRIEIEDAPTSGRSSRSISPQRVRVFDRSSAVERAAFTSGAASDRSDQGSSRGDVSPSRNRIPASLLAASQLDYSALSIPVPGDAVRLGPLPKAAPLITDLEQYSPHALSHIINEQHRREHLQRVTINKRVSHLLEPRRIFKRYGAIEEEADRKAENAVIAGVFSNKGALNTSSARDAIAAVLAAGAKPIMAHHAGGSGGGGEEEKQQPHMSAARQAAQARLSKSLQGHLSDAMLYKGGADSSGVSIPRSLKTSSFLPVAVQQAWELKTYAPRPASKATPEEKKENRRVISKMVARIASPPRNKEAQKVHAQTMAQRKFSTKWNDAAAANEQSNSHAHVIHSPAKRAASTHSSSATKRAQSSPSRAFGGGRSRSEKSLHRSASTKSNTFLTQIQDSDADNIAANNNNSSSNNNTGKQNRNKGSSMRQSRSLSTLPAAPSAFSPAHPFAASPVGGRLGLGTSPSLSSLASLSRNANVASAVSLKHSSSERRYVLGGVKLAETPAPGANFNRALYAHLLHASPNPRGGLQFNHRASYGRMQVYVHRDSRIRVAKHGVVGVAAGKMARTQDLPLPRNAEFLARMAFDEAVRTKGGMQLQQSNSPSPSPSASAAATSPTESGTHQQQQQQHQYPQPQSPQPQSPLQHSRPLTSEGLSPSPGFDRERIAATAAAAAAATKEALRIRVKAERQEKINRHRSNSKKKNARR